ncbi:MAG: histidinol-phosphate transaminase [Proteobacteria bacterium]|nr:histidinol-phosphate transaminase [Pseudomonadota bacterium]
MIDLKKLFCRSAQEMSPYSPIEPPDQIAQRLNLPEEQMIKLDANENPFGTAPAILKALSDGKYYHIYPDPAQVQLRNAIAKYAKCKPETIVAGTGADEVIDITCRLLLEPGERVISFRPTFSYYSHVVALNKGIFDTYPREADFSISLDKAKAIDLDSAKIVILCSPNNPSGNLLEEEVLDYFLQQNLIVMVDEAYHEFSDHTFVEKLERFDNLILLRTFSKCFGMAGLRVGYGIMSEELANGFMRIKPPFSVNVAAEIALKTCLENIPYYRNQVDRIIEIRDWVQKELQSLERLHVFPSRSNFILCRVEGYDAGQLRDELELQGILVRYFDTDQLKNFIRISVGTRSQMEVFLEKLKSLID